MPHAALLLIDLQPDFLPGGALAVPDGNAVIPLANRLAARFETVVLTQDWHPAGHRSFASAHPGRAPFEASMPMQGRYRWGRLADLWTLDTRQHRDAGGLDDAVELLRGRRVNQVPVLDAEGRPAGIVDAADLMDLLPDLAEAA